MVVQQRSVAIGKSKYHPPPICGVGCGGIPGEYIIDHAWAFVGTSVDGSVDAGDDPLSLQAASNSNPKINKVPFTIVPAPIRDKRYIAQSDNCEMPGFPLLKQRACPTVAIAIPRYSSNRCAARRTYRPLTNACAVAEKGGQTNGGLLKGRSGRRAMGSMSGGSISPLAPPNTM
jgi:hypothetical protein